ncbi:unnamed protein product [Rhizophagus irregularis]|uniref:DUF7431 domain-containing protein n=1 Tax=Rhizophagus irregularis TaxID=588596 RepID=A0A2N1NWJ3_9GLOM|nr:hypothetical protein RhiirC2_770413 [Rhizophagus irregularis]CAB4378631.1 unnamed protein product [Rhizophagus irregularis]CAB5369968.1 unnamed protein product [Rhizophagus irregularis]
MINIASLHHCIIALTPLSHDSYTQSLSSSSSIRQEKYSLLSYTKKNPEHCQNWDRIELQDSVKAIDEYISNESEAECNIFPTVVDTDESKNDFFYMPNPSSKPSLIIQRNIKKCKYKLKIGVMIVGYDTNFDFTCSDLCPIESSKA